MTRILEKMITFALSNWKRAPLCERLPLLLSCEGFAFVTHKIVERAPAVGLTRTFDFFAKLNKLKQVVRRLCLCHSFA